MGIEIDLSLPSRVLKISFERYESDSMKQLLNRKLLLLFQLKARAYVMPEQLTQMSHVIYCGKAPNKSTAPFC